MRILIIDDDNELSTAISDKLKEFGYQSDMAENIDDARYFLDIRNYNLVLIDWTLSSIKIADTIKDIKAKHTKTSVIVLSIKTGKKNEINALKSGADDYIKKPIDLDILHVRIEAKLRFGASNIIEINELIISPEEEKIIYNGEDIELKGKPFEVLTHLAMHKDQIVSKEQLLDAIWEEPELVTPNVIEVAINQIRQKMDKPLQITTIETVRRRGYRFCFPNKV
ncbi:MAG: homeostatic response regulator transcription factor HsrA [Sulfurovum sp.]|nr:homeostatic response regulator transcription factor HsrA [Sulfurovum sp.]